MPDIPEPAVQAAAEVLFRDYESQYSADHLTWRDFADLAREALGAAAPVLGDHAAGRILDHMNAHGPKPGGLGRGAWRRHFDIAARIAARAFMTDEDLKREAAAALNRGDYIACPAPEDGNPGCRGTRGLST